MALSIKTKDEFINVNNINKIINDKNKNILIKLKYATKDNFMEEIMYPTPNAWLHPDVADALIKANNFLYWISGKKYRLCLYDAGRPIDVQEKMFNKIQNKDWIDDPNSPSMHNFGLAVDVTIVDKNGNELNMGTKFNEFKDKSKIIYEELYIPSESNSLDMYDSQECMIYRRLLRRAMCEYGFLTNENKWWHFEFVSKEYAIKNKFPKIISYTENGDFTLEEIIINTKINFIENNEKYYLKYNNKIKEYFDQDKDRPKLGYKDYKNDYIILHHTAGHANPLVTIDGWNDEKKSKVSKIATEFVVGGQSLFGDEYYGTEWDGVVVRAFPEVFKTDNNGNYLPGSGHQSYHPGTKGYLNLNSVGIEICNFGYIEPLNQKKYPNQGQTYLKRKPYVDLDSDQIINLRTCKEFEGFDNFGGYYLWHKYSDKQLEEVKKILLHIANRDNIDLHVGLYQWINAKGAKKAYEAFNYYSDAKDGKIKGLLTHANIRTDKCDCSPQPNLIEMIMSL